MRPGYVLVLGEYVPGYVLRYGDVLLWFVVSSGLSASSSSSSTQWTYYKVKSGDNLGKIARRYHCSVSQLKAWNNLKSDRIAIGQKLKIKKK